MFSFAWPWMILLLPLPLLVRFAGPRAKSGPAPGAPQIYFPHVDRLKAIFPGQGQAGKPGRLSLYILATLWLCLILAVMQPQLVDQFAQLQNKGYDLMLA